jgi:hypothetical protein
VSEGQVLDVKATEASTVAMPRDALQSFQRLGIGVGDAIGIANQLRGIVDAKGLAVSLGQGEHLRVEAWTSLASMVGVSAATEWCHEVRDPSSGELEGYHARVRVIRLATGEEIGAAENGCFFDELLTRRDGSTFERWIEHGVPVRHAALSMAQTRAVSKALGQVLRWIPVLAGYSGTPYEEMPVHQEAASPQRERRVVDNDEARISQAQAIRATAIARKVGENVGQHGFEVINHVLSSRGASTFLPRTRYEGVLEHLQKIVRASQYDSFIAAIETYDKTTEEGEF